MVVEHLGISGHVCQEGWDNKEAHVVCRQNGKQTGIVLGHTRQAFFVETRYIVKKYIRTFLKEVASYIFIKFVILISVSTTKFIHKYCFIIVCSSNQMNMYACTIKVVNLFKAD